MIVVRATGTGTMIINDSYESLTQELFVGKLLVGGLGIYFSLPPSLSLYTYIYIYIYISPPQPRSSDGDGYAQS